MEIFELTFDSQFIAKALAGIAVMASILTFIAPSFNEDQLAKRMKIIANEEAKIRQRERARLQESSGVLRYTSKLYMKQLVERLSLGRWLHAEGIKLRLGMAGFRGPQAEIAFLFFRFVSPIGFLVASIFGVTFFGDPDMESLTSLGIVISATFAGIKAPEVYIKNAITKRQAEMRRAFPDALDLLLVCVEGGMSIEHAFRKVSQEMGPQSVALAEEFGLTTAEISYLPDRRVAYNNFVQRTGLDSVKQMATVLVQSEKYGTALGPALRVAAQESREARMMAAEQKAASLPPKLTVPMIVFFLPVLIVVVTGPAGIQVYEMMK